MARLEQVRRYSTGIDSVRFVISKSVALAFLKRIGLHSKLRTTSRNKQVLQFCNDKFKGLKSKNKKYPFKVRYINLKRGVKYLSNTILFIENSRDLHALSRKYKKRLDYFVRVEFAGLHQPSKDLNEATLNTLSQFMRRFKAYSFDLAMDFNMEKEVNYGLKEWFGAHSAKWSGGRVISVGKSLYANRILDSSEYYGLDRILLYDKYYKQKVYHKEKIPERFRHWKRLEVSFILKAKFLDCVENESINEAIDVIIDIARAIGAIGLMGNIDTLSIQLQKLLDRRRKVDFSAWIKEVA